MGLHIIGEEGGGSFSKNVLVDVHSCNDVVAHSNGESKEHSYR
jgi:hypothetical protein